MKSITQNLGNELKSHLKKADEIWVAVALMTKSGLTFIQENIQKDAKQNYILGVDLPTDPAVLESLYKEQLLKSVSVKMFYKQEFYHPKVYIIKCGNVTTAFVGSANCTGNGLLSNIEMSFIINDCSSCDELLKWFKGIDLKSAELTPKFITDYKETYKVRMQRKKQDEELAEDLKQKIKEEYEVTMLNRTELIDNLIKFRKSTEYRIAKLSRQQSIVAIKKTIDYPQFKDIDVDGFFRIWDLGHIIGIPKPTINREIDRFRKLLTVLTDDSIDIATRIDRAMKGDLNIRGVKGALISKILTVHNPKRYFVQNKKIDSVLEKYSIQIPKKMSDGERYKAKNKFLLEIIKESDIEDLAILDHYLYEEAIEAEGNIEK
jgi:HKD family nuclease